MNEEYLQRGWLEYPANGRRNDPPGTAGWEIYVVVVGDSPLAAYALCRDSVAARQFAATVERRLGATEPAVIHKWVSVPRDELAGTTCQVGNGPDKTQVGFAVSRVDQTGAPVSEELRARRFRMVADIIASLGLPDVMDRWRICSEGAYYTGSVEEIDAIRAALQDFEGPGISLCTTCPVAATRKLLD